MKRILINATQNEEIRVALCKGNHLYDFDLENRTREQKKSNIYKGHVTRVEPSLEAVFVEYGSQRQGFLPIREISTEYLSGNPRDENIKKLIKEGDELIVQVEKEERGNKGAALSTYVSLAGRYLVLMPNNPRGGGISRQISGKLREDMKRMLGSLDLPKGMSVIIRTAGIGKTQEDLQHDLNHLLNIWQAIQEQNKKYPSPRLVHQEAGVVTRAVRDYLRDDIAEIWIDNENAYIEAAGFIDAVMPTQAEKLRKYTDYEPMFSRFNIEKQIETAYQREVRLPSGGSIVIDQTEALVSIDINSAKSTKGSDVAETAFHTNLEAADEIARQLRLRDMGGLIVIDFIDMNDNKNQKEVEKRLIDATKYDRARVQFGDISKFGLMEMSRQRLRPSLEESTGYICPRCHGNGMIRDLRSLSLSIMRQIEQIALKERQGEVQAEVPTDIAAFLLNEKRDALVYLEQDSGTRITILPHAHLESPNFKLHFNRDGFAPSSYERITDTAQEHSDLGYDVDWQTSEKERPEQQPTRQPRQTADSADNKQQSTTVNHSNEHRNNKNATQNAAMPNQPSTTVAHAVTAPTKNSTISIEAESAIKPQAVAWLSNLFAQAPQAQMAQSVSSRDAAEAIETLVNTGAKSLGSFGQVDNTALAQTQPTSPTQPVDSQSSDSDTSPNRQQARDNDDNKDDKNEDRRRRKSRKPRSSKPHQRKDPRDESPNTDEKDDALPKVDNTTSQQEPSENDNKRPNDRNRTRQNNDKNDRNDSGAQDTTSSDEQSRNKRKPHSQRNSRGSLERGETLSADTSNQKNTAVSTQVDSSKSRHESRRSQDPNEVVLQVNEAPAILKSQEVVHLSLDDSKSKQSAQNASEQNNRQSDTARKEHTNRAASTSESTDRAKKSSTVSETTSHVDKATSNDTVITERNDRADAESKPIESSDKANAEDSTLSANQITASTDTKVDNEQPLTTVDSQSVDSTTQPTSAPDSKPPSAQTESAVENNSLTGADKEDLFAKRYVTAQRFGQASNDPRVVRHQKAQRTPSALTPTNEDSGQSVAAISSIRGTVGEFIHAMLPEATARLANEGVISCFIDAIAQYQQNAKSTAKNGNTSTQPKISNHTVSASDTDHFDFSNYGYQPLSSDYLARFSAMTKPVTQFAVAQGRTTVTPTAIGKRASNDPRGQHESYQEVALLSETQQHSTQRVTEAEEIVDTTDAAVASVKQIDAHEVEATALTSEGQTENIETDSELLLNAEDSLGVNSSSSPDNHVEESVEDKVSSRLIAEESPKAESQASKSKTTIASYKNMIENVAEQLLPQKGMFNLTTPKIPKARTRKPKVEPKKTAQIEKVETEQQESDS